MAVIILDTETTGLREPEPCEIAYIKIPRELNHYLEKGLLTGNLESFQSRFMVSKPIEPGATKIHGISYTDLIGFPHWSEFKLPEADFIIGHVVNYDAKVLGNPPGYKYICTCSLARQLWPELPNHKLTTIIQEKFPKMAEKLTANAHGALVDCKLCLLIVQSAITEFEGLETWEDLYSLAGVTVTEKPSIPREITTMPFGKHKGKRFSEIPTDYLQWLTTKADIKDQNLFNRVSKELAGR